MSEEKRVAEELNIQVEMVVDKDTPVIYSDWSYINHTQTDFSVYFFLVQPPVGRSLQNNETIPANCRVRIVLSPLHFEIFAKAALENFNIWKKSTTPLTPEKE